MEKILAQARKVAEAAEVFMVSSEETPVQFEANRLKHIQTKKSRSLALRIIKKGRVGYATSNNPDDVSGLVRAAAETARFGMPAEFEFPAATSYPRVGTYDPEVESVSLETMIGFLPNFTGSEAPACQSCQKYTILSSGCKRPNPTPRALPPVIMTLMPILTS